MNTTANADAMTAILRQISLDWNRTISYGRSYIAIFFAYVPGFTCLMVATGSTLDSVAIGIEMISPRLDRITIRLCNPVIAVTNDLAGGCARTDPRTIRIPYRLRSGGGIGSGRQYRLRQHHHARAS